MKKKTTWKTCSRGHRYQGAGPCPICWPGRLKKEKKVKATPHTQYHKDGSVWAKGNMLNGVCDGYWEWFRKDGVKMRSGYFDKGKQIGKWVTYDKKGKVFKITIMK